MEEISTVAAGVSQQAAPDFSLWSMFSNADLTVQLVMIMLVVASFWSWTIIFSKLITYSKVNKMAEQFESTFWSGRSLDTLYKQVGIRPLDPLSSVFSAAMRELQEAKSSKNKTSGGFSLPQRLERVMTVTVSREMDQLERHLGFLATVGAIAPFVGLFGTVWGIMHSFQGIAAMQSTNLAVVAPGIAEALFATALGLVAAIPAVVAYNKLSSDLNRYGMRLDNFVGEFSTLISREFDGE